MMMVMKITIVALGEMLAPARKDHHWQLGAIFSRQAYQI